MDNDSRACGGLYDNYQKGNYVGTTAMANLKKEGGGGALALTDDD